LLSFGVLIKRLPQSALNWLCSLYMYHQEWKNVIVSDCCNQMFKVSGWVSKDEGFKSWRSEGCGYKSCNFQQLLPLGYNKNPKKLGGKSPAKVFSIKELLSFSVLIKRPTQSAPYWLWHLCTRIITNEKYIIIRGSFINQVFKTSRCLRIMDLNLGDLRAVVPNPKILSNFCL